MNEPKKQYTVKDNQLVYDDGTAVNFECPIKKTRDYDELTVVLLETSKNNYSENAFAVDAHGNHLWQVEPVPLYDEPRYVAYTGIVRRDDGIFLYRYDGYIVKVDPETGKILSEEFVK